MGPHVAELAQQRSMLLSLQGRPDVATSGCSIEGAYGRRKRASACMAAVIAGTQGRENPPQLHSAPGAKPRPGDASSTKAPPAAAQPLLRKLFKGARALGSKLKKALPCHHNRQ